MTDPDRWPLAPGNASPEVEERLTAEAARWPEPSTALREQVTGILTRPERRTTAA
ncbi:MULTISPECIES: hypothetical protein [Gordonia]|uniref:Uncharacterized protein n=1 Tax=Gordonia sihwensis NBRC 108236 TaxID=1223544 RepID=L7LHM7_9ACTN|nr:MULTISPECIES: hypothetical protein [Gordonia]GAC60615.1 hypothetical protein GSI01S_10_02070 [Gordonia sihwensis NBRC 108236]